MKIFNWLILMALFATSCSTDVGAETTSGVDSIDVDSTGALVEIPTLPVEGEVTVTSNVDIMVNDTTTSTTSIMESTTTTLTGSNSSVVSVNNSSTTTKPVEDRPLSQAWLDSVTRANYRGSLEDMRFSEEYWLNNPNQLLTPMGAFCWAYHEIYSVAWRLLSFSLLSSHIEWLMNELDITVTQVGEIGFDRNTAVLDILAEGDDKKPTPVGNILEGDTDEVGSIQELNDEEKARLLFYSDEYIEHYRIENRIGGDGTEWYDALRSVADPKILEATRANGGLPIVVQSYADRFFATVNRLATDTRLETDDSYAWDFYDSFDTEIPLPVDLVSFMEEAKYSQDCKRADLTSLDYE